jgi:hypothetical protein
MVLGMGWLALPPGFLLGGWPLPGFGGGEVIARKGEQKRTLTIAQL